MEDNEPADEAALNESGERQAFNAAPLEDPEERKAIFAVLDSFRWVLQLSVHGYNEANQQALTTDDSLF